MRLMILRAAALLLMTARVATAAGPADPIYAGDAASGTTWEGFRKGGPYLLVGRDTLACRSVTVLRYFLAPGVQESLGPAYVLTAARSGCVLLPSHLPVNVRSAGSDVAMIMLMPPVSRVLFIGRTVVQGPEGVILPEFTPDPYSPDVQELLTDLNQTLASSGAN